MASEGVLADGAIAISPMAEDLFKFYMKLTALILLHLLRIKLTLLLSSHVLQKIICALLRIWCCCCNPEHLYPVCPWSTFNSLLPPGPAVQPLFHPISQAPYQPFLSQCIASPGFSCCCCCPVWQMLTLHSPGTRGKGRMTNSPMVCGVQVSHGWTFL